MRVATPITFVLVDAERLDRLASLDPDRDWRELVTGERAWVLQTYLRLRASGRPVRFSDRLPEHGIAVFSCKQRHLLRRLAPARTSALLVGIRQDVGEAPFADFEIVQNPSQADAERRFHVPSWPQPGLVPRDPARDTRIETVVYKGFTENLHPDLASGEWRAFLRAEGLRWRLDSVAYRERVGAAAVAPPAERFAALAWNDFRDVDLVVAVRPPNRGLHQRKPATKLYNAWLAGVPALLGPEVAYRSLRASDLDYIEVGSRDEAEAAVKRLRTDPRLYRMMVDNGRKRAEAFTVDCIAEQWARLLVEVLPARANAPHVVRWRGKPLWLKSAVRRLRIMASHRAARSHG